jgi:hypothetical protein
MLGDSLALFVRCCWVRNMVRNCYLANTVVRTSILIVLRTSYKPNSFAFFFEFFILRHFRPLVARLVCESEMTLGLGWINRVPRSPPNYQF